MKTINALAVAIADTAVRSDVEIYAAPCSAEDLQFYNTAMTAPGCGPDELAAVQRALDYIEKRGDVFPWYMQRHISAPHLVRFIEKEAQ